MSASLTATVCSSTTWMVGSLMAATVPPDEMEPATTPGIMDKRPQLGAPVQNGTRAGARARSELGRWARVHIVRFRPAQYPRGRYPLRVPDLTSLKVPSEVRDRFATAAKVRGLSVRALLDQLSREAADAALMDQAAKQMSRLHETDPDAWNEYLAEGRHWEEGTIEPLDA